jgi:hypothetical protein
METKEDTKKYSTKSIDSAACVMALGARIVGVKREKEEDRFLTFMFEADFDMESASLQLASETLMINAYKLCESMRRLKSLIHSRA